MKQKKLLITGISGFLGACFADFPQATWRLIGTHWKNPIQDSGLVSQVVDLTQITQVHRLINTVQPDAVIHLAAAANPNFCEQHPKVTEDLNVKAAVELSRRCHAHSIPFLFVSSDLVFAGDQAPYDEQAATGAVNLYGQQKARAEKAILELYPEACVARCPVMFGLPRWGSSFMASWINKLRANEPVFAFTDEYRTKVSGLDAVRGFFLLLEKEVSGIWHLGGKASLSRYEFALRMAEMFNLPTSLIRASQQADVKMAAARPSNVSLNSEKAFRLGYAPESIETALRRLYARGLV